MTRLSISLDDDLYAMARAHAVANRLSISKAISALLRRGDPGPPPGEGGKKEAATYFDPVLGIQVSRGRRAVTSEDVRRAEEEEDARHWKETPPTRGGQPS